MIHAPRSRIAPASIRSHGMPGVLGRVLQQRALFMIPALACAACARGTPPPVAYAPRARDLTVTTVPLLVQEQRKLFPFLAAAFAKGGVLDGKEVYAFSPSTLTVVEGDTIHFTFINPEDDVHSFVLPDFAVSLPGAQMTRATYVARHAGIFPILCAIPSHLPMMSGQLVVLSPAAVVDSTSQAAQLRAGGVAH
jgi:plastocyanin